MITRIWPLWLVVARHAHRQEPLYLLTSEPLHKDAWTVAYAYVRRWQIEMSSRYG